MVALLVRELRVLHQEEERGGRRRPEPAPLALGRGGGGGGLRGAPRL